jgi:hypothetical protein
MYHFGMLRGEASLVVDGAAVAAALDMIVGRV